MLQQVLSDFEWNVLAGYQIGKSYREIASELALQDKVGGQRARAHQAEGLHGSASGSRIWSELLVNSPLR